MKRTFFVGTLAFLLAGATTLRADVRTDEKSLVKFEGALGRMIGFFGGKSAREGIVSKVAVAGDRKSTLSDHAGQIVDLAEEKVYDLDLRKRTYTVTTFAELRQKAEEARRRAAQQAAQNEKASDPSEKPEKEYELDLDVRETGQKKAINGFDTREIVMTVTVREKGKTLEQGGGMVLTADSWLAQRIPALAELAQFDHRYAEKLMGSEIQVSAEQMAAAFVMYPGLSEAMKKYRAENVNLEGTPILTTLTFEGVRTAEQVVQERDSEESQAQPTSIGGLMGGFGRKMARKKSDGSTQPSNRATVMTMTHEVLAVSTSVPPGGVEVPAGFTKR